MRVSLDGTFELDFFEIEELESAEQYAKETEGSIYSWKTTGNSNWLEKRLSIVDVLGLAILPKNLPEWIDLPDDGE
ncbi:MAG: hypothetical protein ABI904_22550 [Chloroflexota bacterium]